MSFFKSLPFKLLLGIFIGGFIGVWACNNHTQTYAMNILQVIVSIHRLLGQFVSFCVPLIILGFICQNRHKCRKSFRSKSYYSIYFFNSCCYYISVAGYPLVPQHGSLLLMLLKEQYLMQFSNLIFHKLCLLWFSCCMD